MTDMEIIRRVRSGKTNAYEDLVLKYEKRIFNAVMSIVKNEQDSLDITQNVFIKAYMHIGNFNENSQYYTYLFKIAINECKDHLKKAFRNDLSLIDEEGNPLEVADTKEDPGSLAEFQELKIAVNQCILELPEDLRDALVLRSIYGFTYNEIAVSLNIEPGTVKSRISRGREKVRNSLAERNLL